jgi:hypothetical protein
MEATHNDSQTAIRKWGGLENLAECPHVVQILACRFALAHIALAENEHLLGTGKGAPNRIQRPLSGNVNRVDKAGEVDGIAQGQDGNPAG